MAGNKKSFPAKDLTRDALLSALLFISQLALSWLPNLELVSLLLILYTLVFKKHVWLILYVFVLLQGLVYGFGLWWFYYLYVWAVLCALIRFIYRNRKPTVFGISLISGTFGLLFGLLCALSYGIIAGPGTALFWWISGIPFDITHGILNFVLAFVLFRPLYQCFLFLSLNQ